MKYDVNYEYMIVLTEIMGNFMTLGICMPYMSKYNPEVI